MAAAQPLTDAERAVYEWQLVGARTSARPARSASRAASVLVSRVGGVGGIVAYQLAAAGVGRLVLAHAGNLRPERPEPPAADDPRRRSASRAMEVAAAAAAAS